MGGLRGGSSLASWAVAGTLAYFLWVRPSQQLKREQEAKKHNLFFFFLPKIRYFNFVNSVLFGDLQERAALAAASDSYRYVEKRKPIPDPQVSVVVDFELCEGGFEFD